MGTPPSNKPACFNILIGGVAIGVEVAMSLLVIWRTRSEEERKQVGQYSRGGMERKIWWEKVVGKSGRH